MKNKLPFKLNLLSLIIIISLILLLIVVITKDFRYYYTFLFITFLVFICFFGFHKVFEKISSLFKNNKTQKNSYIFQISIFSILKLIFLGGILVIAFSFQNIFSWEISFFIIAISPLISFFWLKDKKYED